MSNDESGTPVWSPIVLDGGGEGKTEPAVGSRPLWNIKNAMPGDSVQTEFDIRLGTKPVKFKVIGTKNDAVAVVSALRMSDRIARNAMRMSLDYAVSKEGLDVSANPTLSAFGPEELEKMQGFFQWMVALGNAMLSSGLRPWHGKKQGVEEDKPGLAIVKPSEGDGDAGNDSSLN